MRYYELRLLFEPTTLHQKVIKWVAIILVNVVSVSAFVSIVLDLSHLQRVCRDAIYVEAVISASRGEDTWVGDPVYEWHLSYKFNGKQYTEIPYDSGRSAARLDDDGKTIRVMIDQENPTQFANKIVNTFGSQFSLILFSFGISMLIYGIAVEVPDFCQKRLELQQRKYPHLTSLDHWPDVALLTVIFSFLVGLTLLCVFPNVNWF